MDDDELFDYYQYTHYALIYLDKTHLRVRFDYNRIQNKNLDFEFIQNINACFIYDKKESNILKYGRDAFDDRLDIAIDENAVYVDNILDQLYEVYLSNKGVDGSQRSQAPITQYFAKFLVNCVEEAIKSDEMGKEPQKMDNLHYVYIVPAYWDYEIREDLLRPIFVQANLISRNDHSNRLLFFTKLDSILYYYQATQIIQKTKCKPLEKDRLYLMCDLEVPDDDISSCFTLFESKYPSPVISGSIFTKVIHCEPPARIISVKDIEKNLKIFLERKIFDKSCGTSLKISLDDQACESNNIIEALVNYYKENQQGDSNGNDVATDGNQLLPFDNFQFSDLNMTSAKVSTIKSITSAEINTFVFATAETTIIQKLQQVFSSNRQIHGLMLVQSKKYIFSKTYPYHVINAFYAYFKDIIETFRIQLSYQQLANFGDRHVLEAYKQDHVLVGAVMKILERVGTSNLLLPPRIVPGVSEYSPTVISAPLPDIVITIDMGLQTTTTFSVLLDSNNKIERIIDGASEMLPLSKFFEISDLDSREVGLLISAKSWIIQTLKSKFAGILNKFSKYDRTVTASPRKDNYSLAPTTEKEEKEMATMLEKSQPRYLRALLIIFLAYWKTIVIDQLSKHIGEDIFKDKKIGYVISIEKVLLNALVGEKDDLRELALFNETDNHPPRPLHIITHGEGVLPKFHNQFPDIDLQLKSYYVQAEIRENYIQLTLNQVVKTPTDGKNASTIIIKDEIVKITNTDEKACRYLWQHIQSHLGKGLLTDCCDLHQNKKKEDLQSLCSKENYEQFLVKLKLYLTENFISGAVHNASAIEISSTCACKVLLTDHDVFEIAFRPVLKDISLTIASSLVDNNLFGHYNMSQLIVFGCFIDSLQQHSGFYQELTAQLKIELMDALEIKELDTPCSVLLKSSSMLYQPASDDVLLLFDSFEEGYISKVSSETYLLSFMMGSDKDSGYSNKEIFYKDGGVGKLNTMEESEVAIILRKGQVIPHEGCSRTFYINLGEEEAFQAIELLRLVSPNGEEKDQTMDYHSIDCDLVDTFKIFPVSGCLELLVKLEIIPQSYSSQLDFTISLSIDDPVDNYRISIGEPLTLSYFQHMII